MRNPMAVEMKLHQICGREEAFHGFLDKAALRSRPQIAQGRPAIVRVISCAWRDWSRQCEQKNRCHSHQKYQPHNLLLGIELLG